MPLTMLPRADITMPLFCHRQYYCLFSYAACHVFRRLFSLLSMAAMFSDAISLFR